MGLDVDAIDEMGGAATFAEMQQAIDESTYDELIAARDIVRRDFLQEVLPLWPGSPVMAFIAANFDNPSLVGVALAFRVDSIIIT